MTNLRNLIVMLLAGAGALAAPAAAQFKPATLTVHPVRAGAYWLGGGIANSGFVVGDKGVVVIDTQFNTGDARTALAEIAKITPKPVSAVIVSHGDPDHIGGLLAYPSDATVIEHEATPPYVLAAAKDAAHGGPFGAAYVELAKHAPTRTIGSTETLMLDGVRMTLLHVASAHTGGDLVVFLPAQKTVYAGDILLTTQRFPVIHFGGSSLGWIATMKAMLALNADTYVPGHGAVEPKAQVVARLHDVEQTRDAIKTMVRDGKPLADVQAAFPEQPSPFPTFVETIYQELTTGYPAATPPWANTVRPELMRR